ncbi:MAG: hypothetical protein K2P99_01920 [Burkholderiales bacterium]|nr:hypothetical protein [Burkholderiales bacterium]
MDKKIYEEQTNRQKEAKIARIKALSATVSHKVEDSRITKPSSPYRPFEISFGAERFKEINDFLFSLAESEFENYPYINDPLLLMCQKFLDWKVEVGNDRLWHELFVRYDGGKHSENNEGSTYVIKKAWGQIKKEQEIIEISRQAYKARLDKVLEDNPKMPSTDPAHWYTLCDGFNQFEALKEFGYPLPFDSVFGPYIPKRFYGKPLDDNKLFGEQQ